MLFLTFSENGFNFVTQRLQKTENFPVQMLGKFVSDLKEASKPVSKGFLWPILNLNGLDSFLAFQENSFNFTTGKFPKNLKKYPF